MHHMPVYANTIPHLEMTRVIMTFLVLLCLVIPRQRKFRHIHDSSIHTARRRRSAKYTEVVSCSRTAFRASILKR